MKHLVFPTLAGALALALVAGCGTFVPDGDDTAGTARLDLYGGYTTASEAPGFGDADLLASHPEDTPYDDDMIDNPEIGNALKNRAARMYMLRLVWGNLENPDSTTTACPVTDWSGSLVTDGGVLVVRRLIRFEPGDYIVRPRRGAHQVQWVSHTAGHLDGLLVQIIDIPGQRNTAVRNAVTISTPLFTSEIPFDSLASYAATFTIDECNEVALTASEISRPGCPHGFLEGAWASESDTSGVFRGAWIKDNGELDGYLRGRYTIENGRRVLFGKWITASGDFGGLMRGTWGPIVADRDGAGTPDGCFSGHWVNDALTAQGVFSGHYCLPEEADTAGFFHGRWKADCR
jgi:hypothetical protein